MLNSLIMPDAWIEQEFGKQMPPPYFWGVFIYAD